jgi:hypothetical protein
MQSILQEEETADYCVLVTHFLFTSGVKVHLRLVKKPVVMLNLK